VVNVALPLQEYLVGPGHAEAGVGPDDPGDLVLAAACEITEARKPLGQLSPARQQSRILTHDAREQAPFEEDPDVVTISSSVRLVRSPSSEKPCCSPRPDKPNTLSPRSLTPALYVPWGQRCARSIRLEIRPCSYDGAADQGARHVEKPMATMAHWTRSVRSRTRPDLVQEGPEGLSRALPLRTPAEQALVVGPVRPGESRDEAPLFE
jgi:hypothetical protein